MKVVVKEWQAVAQWQWDTGKKEDDSAEDGEEDVCGICRNPFEGYCPSSYHNEPNHVCARCADLPAELSVEAGN